ncbi:EpsG family protein [Clostridiaceae bacterium OM02-2AC]|nr:EpsG family protein [Clostridiaceae bacterium OM02-2AC]
MYIYFIPYFLICIMSILVYKKKMKRNTFLIISLIILFLFAGLRGNGKGDYYAYIWAGKQITHITDIFNYRFPMEIGFRILALLQNALKLTPQGIIIFMALLSTTLIYLIIKKSKNYLISLIIFLPYFLQFDMHASRTAIAACLASLSIYSYTKKAYKKTILLFILAMSFHRSAIVVLIYPVLDFINRKLNEKKYNIIIFMSSLFFLVISVRDILFSLANLFPSFKLFNQLLSYLSSDKYGYALKIYDPRIILAFLVFILLAIWLPEKNKNNRILYISSSASLLLISILHFNTFLALRLSYFFAIYSIISIPEVIKYQLSTNRNLGKLLTMGCVFIFFLYFAICAKGMINYQIFF